jgi:hypothetical protein
VKGGLDERETVFEAQALLSTMTPEWQGRPANAPPQTTLKVWWRSREAADRNSGEQPCGTKLQGTSLAPPDPRACLPCLVNRDLDCCNEVLFENVYKYMCPVYCGQSHMPSPQFTQLKHFKEQFFWHSRLNIHRCF